MHCAKVRSSYTQKYQTMIYFSHPLLFQDYITSISLVLTLDLILFLLDLIIFFSPHSAYFLYSDIGQSSKLMPFRILIISGIESRINVGSWTSSAQNYRSVYRLSIFWVSCDRFYEVFLCHQCQCGWGLSIFMSCLTSVLIKLYFYLIYNEKLKTCNRYKKLKPHKSHIKTRLQPAPKIEKKFLSKIQLNIIIRKTKKMLATVGLNYCRRRYYDFVGLTIRHRKLRWFSTFLIATIYLYRAVGLSYDVITYLIGFYFLQLLVSYLTPKGLDEDEPEEQYDEYTGNLIIQAVDTCSLPDFNSEFEFENPAQSEKPLISSLSESQIWERITFAFVLGIICTMFKAIEIDVFWPLLMFYFVVLVCYTVHKIAKKMQKYNYSISDFNKRNNFSFTSSSNFAP